MPLYGPRQINVNINSNWENCFIEIVHRALPPALKSQIVQQL